MLRNRDCGMWCMSAARVRGHRPRASCITWMNDRAQSERSPRRIRIASDMAFWMYKLGSTGAEGVGASSALPAYD